MKSALIISILVIVTVASAAVFEPEFYIEGLRKLDGNSIDFFHFDQGFSISSTHRTILSTQSLRNETELDYDANQVKITFKFNNIELTQPAYISIETYYNNMYRSVFRKKLDEKILELLGNTTRSEGEGLIPEIVIELPKIALPKSVRRFMGDKAGRLSLDGSQRLTVNVRNTARDNAVQDEGDTTNDIDIEFQQDLDIRLHGTIGEKIHVDVNHRSTSDDDAMVTPSEINVSYEGDEDEIVQSIEAGNISLSLSGSQYISYSISSEGLFGIKTDMKIGNLSLTTILGKDEAKKETQKYNGNSRADSTVIESRNFVRRTHYYVEDPTLMYQLYTQADIDEDTNIPPSWIGNAIKLDDDLEWDLTTLGIRARPKPNEDITIYLDDHDANNNITTVGGIEIGFPDFAYNFDVLIQGTDYLVDYDKGIIIIMQTITELHTIGITYTRVDGTVVGNDYSSPVEVKLLRLTNQDVADSEYWNLQVRNQYSLGMQNIKNDGFDLKIYQINEDETPNYDLPPSLSTGDYLTYNDYLRLDSTQEGVINGEDTTINLESGYIIFPFLRPFESLGDSLLYQDETVSYNEFENYISVKGQIGRDQISLGQMNILPNSVVIKIGPNDTKLQENIDFIVDYDFGQITFLTPEAKDTEVEIDISYQYKPLFSVDSKTIMGMRADMQFSPNISMGGTFIYQSEKVREDRPKIGNENRSIILADIDGELDYEVPLITKIIDFIPLIKTDERSNVSFSSEVAMSIPHIFGSSKQYDSSEAYIDDMEAILDAFPLGVTRSSWSPASKPAAFPSGNYINYGKADINYYMPQNIYMRNVYDPESLTEKEERDKVSILACKIKPNEMGMPGSSSKSWAGIMKYVGNQLDFSKKKYLEFLVKVDTLNHNISIQKPITMHIDLGNINENFYTFTDKNGEGILDLEDGLKTRDGIFESEEDVGLDRIDDDESGDDPNDNWSKEKIILNGEEEYPFINGTEGNNKLDTEDLDSNGILNMEDVYFEYSLPLNSGDMYLQSEFKGWKLYRIPLHEEDNYQIISDQANLTPDIKEISYARVWFEVEDSTRIKIASLDIVGNKWEEDHIRNDAENIIVSEDETMKVGIIDNQKNQHYMPAPHTVIEKLGEETLEQSLIIDYENLGAGHHGLVSQEFRESFNLLSYKKLRLWVYAESAEDNNRSQPDSLIMRLGVDSLHYYEIRHKLDTQDYKTEMDIDGWREIEFDFTELTQLKALSESEDVSYTSEGFLFRKVGNPTLTNILKLSLGMKASEEFTGRIYFDDIRVADPYEEIGYAARATFHTSFADFSSLDVTYNWQTQNFQSSAQRSNLTFKENMSLNMTNRYNLNKFFPAEWGLSLPLTLTRNQSLGIPRYKANSDILRVDLSPEERERQKEKALTYRATLNYSQSKTPRSKIVEFITKNTSLSGIIEKRRSLTASVADTTLAFEIKHNYDMNIPPEEIDLKLWGDYKFFFFPKLFTNEFKFNESQPSKWRWDSYIDTLQHWIPQSNSFVTRTFNTNTQVKYDVFSDIASTYKIITKRDLMLENFWKELNIGKEKERTQDISLAYTPKYFEGIFSFDADASVSYNEDHLKSSIQDSLFYKGNVDRKINGRVTLKNRNMLLSLVNWMEGGSSQTTSQEEEIPEKNDEGEKSENKEQIKNLQEPNKNLEKPKEKSEEFSKPQELPEKENGIVPKEKPKESENEDDEEIKSGDEENQENLVERPNIAVAIITYIARLDNISVNYNSGYRTSYDDRIERPEFLYQLGFPHILKEEEGIDQEITLKTISDKYSTSVNFPILNVLSTTWGYSREIRRTYGNSSKAEYSTVFPNVSVALTEFEKLIHLGKILTSSRLSSTFVLTTTESGDIDFIKPDTEMIRMNFSPLLSWSGNWVHNITSSLSFNYSDSKSTRIMNSYNIITTAQSATASSQLSWSFSNPKGLKILFFKRTSMKNELTTNLNFTFEKTLNTTLNTNVGGDPIKDVNRTKYGIQPGASYEFNRSISAGLTSNYEWNRDEKRGKGITTYSLGIWVEILF